MSGRAARAAKARKAPRPLTEHEIRAIVRICIQEFQRLLRPTQTAEGRGMRKLSPQDVEHAEDEVARIVFGRGYGRATDDEMATAAKVVEAVLRRTRTQESPDAP